MISSSSNLLNVIICQSINRLFKNCYISRKFFEHVKLTQQKSKIKLSSGIVISLATMGDIQGLSDHEADLLCSPIDPATKV